jgi:hypothetical protein
MLVKDKSKILKKFTSKTLAKPDRVSITSAVYNHNGTGLMINFYFIFILLVLFF